jgi:hypothetical protein
MQEASTADQMRGMSDIPLCTAYLLLLYKGIYAWPTSGGNEIKVALRISTPSIFIRWPSPVRSLADCWA